jgi:hypothetical protein
MTNIVLLVIVLVVVIGGGLLILFGGSSKGTAKPSTALKDKSAPKTATETAKTTEAAPAAVEANQALPVASAGKNPDIPDTGQVTTAGKDAWTLNPNSTFPLTIYPVDASVAQLVKGILDAGYTQTATKTIGKLKPLLIEHGIRCKQVDEYISVFKPRYMRFIEQTKTDSASWAGASAGGMSNVLSAINDKAIGSLEIQPSCDLEALFEGSPAEGSPLDRLKSKFGPEVVAFYTARKPGIYDVPPEHPDRKGFERLTELKLAAAGSRTNPKLVLKRLKLGDMQKVVADLNYPPFTTEELAYAVLSELPDLRHRLNGVVNYKVIYEVLPMPADIVRDQSDNATSVAKYATELARLLVATYFKAGNAVADREAYKGRSYSFIKGWEISAAKDCCPYCRKAAQKKFEKKDYPKVPLHLGCRCNVITTI